MSFLLSTGRGGGYTSACNGGVCIPSCNGTNGAGVCIPASNGAGGVCPGEVFAQGGVSAKGVSTKGLCLPRGCLPPPGTNTPPETATEANGTHPAEMHSSDLKVGDQLEIVELLS